MTFERSNKYMQKQIQEATWCRVDCNWTHKNATHWLHPRYHTTHHVSHHAKECPMQINLRGNMSYPICNKTAKNNNNKQIPFQSILTSGCLCIGNPTSVQGLWENKGMRHEAMTAQDMGTGMWKSCQCFKTCRKAYQGQIQNRAEPSL